MLNGLQGLSWPGLHPARIPRDGCGPALGLVLAGGASLVLWTMLAHAARWAAHLL